MWLCKDKDKVIFTWEVAQMPPCAEWDRSRIPDHSQRKGFCWYVTGLFIPRPYHERVPTESPTTERLRADSPIAGRPISHKMPRAFMVRCQPKDLGACLAITSTSALFCNPYRLPPMLAFRA
ncbi:hypothetical protein P691DRAFT_811304 [Macrolepiota fuliginosa MF-IS2]|uniref:Uncharacterized protein n=1 Tax=Macrolepiota fuliginosa MF-IS2 TaxID=1400762 RepID=A0A9P5WZR2_9AGAR|nr:hypothetical protein P691DRAFT_811304 [Macrolepiota fuliginosa MF-IS2]